MTEPHLTEREQQILELIGEGLTNKEIAFRLSTRSSTVGTHCHNLYRKLNVTSRCGAIRYFILTELAKPT